MYEKIKNWYEAGFWTRRMVRNAVIKGKISEEEYQEITEPEYVELTGMLAEPEPSDSEVPPAEPESPVEESPVE